MSSAARATALARERGDAGLQVLASGVAGALLASGGRPGDGLSTLARSHQAAAGAGRFADALHAAHTREPAGR